MWKWFKTFAVDVASDVWQISKYISGVFIKLWFTMKDFMEVLILGTNVDLYLGKFYDEYENDIIWSTPPGLYLGKDCPENM